MLTIKNMDERQEVKQHKTGKYCIIPDVTSGIYTTAVYTRMLYAEHGVYLQKLMYNLMQLTTRTRLVDKVTDYLKIIIVCFVATALSISYDP